MKNFALIIFCILLLGVNLQAEWEEDTILAESYLNQHQGNCHLAGNTFWCSVEEVDSLLAISIQGMNNEEELFWAESIKQYTLTDHFRNIVIGCSAEEIFLLWRNYDENGYCSLSMQKIDFQGNKIWGEYGITITELIHNSLKIIPDNNGGVYLTETYGNPPHAWYYNAEGEHNPEWQGGIELGVDDNVVYCVNEKGNLGLLHNRYNGEEAGSYFQILRSDASFLYEDYGIYICPAEQTPLAIYSLEENEYLFAWEEGDNITGNKLLADCELLYAENVLLSSSGEIFDSFHRFEDSIFLVLLSDSFCSLEASKFNYNWELQPEVYEVNNENRIFYLQFKPEEHILIASTDWGKITISEYNYDGTLISPEEGWLTLADIPTVNFYGPENGDLIILRSYSDYAAQQGFLLQVIDNDGQLLFPGEGLSILEEYSIYSNQKCCLVPQTDKTVFCWNIYDSTWDQSALYMQYLDENGNPLLGENALLMLNSNEVNAFDFQVLYQDEEKILVLAKNDTLWSEVTYYVFCLALDETPYHMWGDEGVELCTLGGSRTINFHKLSAERYLFYWQAEDHYYGQVIENGETILQPETMITPANVTILSIKGSYFVYQEGYGIYVNRWDENMETEWSSGTWIAAPSYFDSESIEYIDEAGNLVMYWGSLEIEQIMEESWRLKKQVITPEGEKLLGNTALEIHNTGDNVISRFFEQPELNQTGILSSSNGNLRVNYINDQDDLVYDEFIEIEEMNNRYIYEIITIEDMLFIKNAYTEYTGSSLINLAVFYLDGEPVPGMPDADFSLANPYFSNFAVDEENISYCWMENRFPKHEATFYGYNDIKAQQISLDIVKESETEIIPCENAIRAYPNPFNPTITIEYNNSSAGREILEIFNVKGQRVKRLRIKDEGLRMNKVTWDGRDDHGKTVGSGVYFIRLQTGDEIVNEKVLLMK